MWRRVGGFETNEKMMLRSSSGRKGARGIGVLLLSRHDVVLLLFLCRQDIVMVLLSRHDIVIATTVTP